jgi:hypothetical protein
MLNKIPIVEAIRETSILLIKKIKLKTISIKEIKIRIRRR